MTDRRLAERQSERAVGFTDRGGLGRATEAAGDPKRLVQIFCRRVSERPAALLVCERGTGITAWLPRSQITVESGGVSEPADLADIGETLRITLPAWLAVEKGLVSFALDERQGSLL